MIRRAQHGFTLIEVLVAVSLGILVLGLVMTSFLSQQKAYASIDLNRISQESGRDAMLEMETSLRRLGFGIDPRYAIDMRTYACAIVPCRDRINGPDELVFVARNPNYRWLDFGESGCATAGGCFSGNAFPITVAGTALSLTLPVGVSLHKGRVLELVCPNGQQQTMVQLSAPAGPGTGAAITVLISPTAAANPYRENAYSGGSNACYATPGAVAFLVDRYRYAVSTTVAADPYLVLDTGLDLNGDGVTPDAGDLDDLIPIAKGVEDLQVAYILNDGTTAGRPALDSNTDWIVGNQSGAFEELNPTLAAPVYATVSTDPLRFNLHPANVRAIRITISVRSSQPDAAPPDSWTGDPLSLAENRNLQLPSYGRYRRSSISATINVRNLSSRSTFMF